MKFKPIETCEAPDSGLRGGASLLSSPTWAWMFVSILKSTRLIPGSVRFFAFVWFVCAFICSFFEVGFHVDPNGIKLAM